MTIQELVAKLVSGVGGDLALKGAGPVALLVLLVVGILIARALWSVAVDVVKKSIEPWLTAHGRAGLIVFFGLPALAAAVFGRLGTAVLMIIVGVLAGVIAERRHFQYRLLPLSFLVAAVLAGALAIEGMFLDYVRRQDDERFTVYVLLPFAGRNGEAQQTLVDLSISLRDTVKTILASVADVSIHPESLSVADLNQWKDPSSIVTRLRGDGIEPDILLINDGGLKSYQQTQYLTVSLCAKMPRKTAATLLFDEKPPIRTTGLREDITYLAIRAALALVDQLKRHRGPPLIAPQTEKEIVDKAADEYLKQLQVDSVCPAPSELCRAATAAANAPSLTLARLIEITSQYPPDQTAEVTKINARTSPMWLQKLFPAPEPQPPVPADPGEPAAPVAPTGVGS